MADTLPWDPARAASDRAGYNGGCPLGYFAQFVALGEDDAVLVPGSTSHTAVRCRVMPKDYRTPTELETDIAIAQSRGGVPDYEHPTQDSIDVVMSESGTSTSETLANLRAAVAATVPQVATELVLLGVLAAAFLWFTRR